jgi:flagellar hook-associated protein 2
MDILSTSNINNLVNSSKQSEYFKRVNPLLERKSKFSELSSTWGGLKSSLNSFKTLLSSLKDVNSGGSFTAKTTTLSSDDYFSVTANSSASLSTYDVRVDQLAKHDRVMSDTVVSSDLANLSAGTYSFQVTSGESDEIIAIELNGSETREELMEHISDAINDAMSDIVSSSVFSPKSGESKLSLVSAETGETNAITIQDMSGSLLSSIGMDFPTRTVISDDNLGGYTSSLGDLNAVLEFNGITVQRNSNIIDDLINDVTISLKSAMEVGIPTVNIIVKNNVEEFKTDIEDFISKFNDSYQFVKNNYYSNEDGSRGIFVGNATALGMMQSFSNVAYQQVEGIESGNLSFLSDIGIEFDPASGLKIDDNDLLEEALEGNPDQVATLFNSENGVANKLYDLVDSYVKTDGVITNLIDSYDSSVSYLADKISYKENQIDKNAQVLRHQYEQMQLQLSSLYEMQNYFSMAGIF